MKSFSYFIRDWMIIERTNLPGVYPLAKTSRVVSMIVRSFEQNPIMNVKDVIHRLNLSCRHVRIHLIEANSANLIYFNPSLYLMDEFL
jgi:hypothetical protein